MHTQSSKLRKWSHLVATLAAAAFLLQGCGGGDDGAAGAPGTAGKDVDPAVVTDLTTKITALTQAVNPEQCSLCHKGSEPVARSGAKHQEEYNQLYQDGAMKVVAGSIAIASNGVDTTTLTFRLTKNGAAFDCTKPTATFPNGTFALGAYWATYDTATKTFPDDLGLTPSVNSTTGAVTATTGSKAYDAATGVCTVKKIVTSTTDKAIVAKIAAAGTNGVVTIYGADEIVEKEGSIIPNKYPFAGILKVGTVDYSSAANVSGCQNCHTQPFLKHAYIYGNVKDNTGATTEFYTCKGCHYDNRTGGHLVWQVLGDAKTATAADLAKTPAVLSDATKALRARAVAINASNSAATATEATKYAYKAKLMNDVHMSHAMEFAYPQSMKNCVTCHEGKLDTVLADSKFKAETCISCHSVDGITNKMTAAAYNHSSLISSLTTTDCAGCHKTGGVGPSFKTVHNGGYEPKIYTSTGVRYSDTIKATIDSVSFASNKLTIKFSATGTAGGLSASSIAPTVLVGLYGYDTKDFIVAAHGSTVINGASARNLEYVVGATHPRFMTVKASGGSWEVTADLTLWADKITAKTVKRAEIAVLPTLKDAAGVVVGLNAPSKTFNFAANAFENYFTTDIVKVAKTTGTNGRTTGCNTCHDQLATTFHSADRGGNIKVCRICHEVSNPGAHLELQSRSIDSYVHAIHSFQKFDMAKVDFADAFEQMEYGVHTGTSFPTFGITNCEACHNTGMYDVPAQNKSLPGVISATATVTGWPTRQIGGVVSQVSGPAARACGGCHRAQKINADDATGLAVIQQHFKTFGYLPDNATGLWDSIVAKLLTLFN